MSDNEQDCMEDIFECTLPVPKIKPRGSHVTTLPRGESIWGDKTLNRPSPMMYIENQVEMLQKQTAEAMSVNIRPSIKIPTVNYSIGCSVSDKDLIMADHTNPISVGSPRINDDIQFSIVPSNIQASSVVLETSAGKIQVNYDGSIEIEGNVHFDTVACKFWDAVSENAPGNNSIIDRLKKENAELKTKLSNLETEHPREKKIAFEILPNTTFDIEPVRSIMEALNMTRAQFNDEKSALVEEIMNTPIQLGLTPTKLSHEQVKSIKDNLCIGQSTTDEDKFNTAMELIE